MKTLRKNGKTVRRGNQTATDLCETECCNPQCYYIAVRCSCSPVGPSVAVLCDQVETHIPIGGEIVFNVGTICYRVSTASLMVFSTTLQIVSIFTTYATCAQCCGTPPPTCNFISVGCPTSVTVVMAGIDLCDYDNHCVLRAHYPTTATFLCIRNGSSLYTSNFIGGSASFTGGSLGNVGGICDVQCAGNDVSIRVRIGGGLQTFFDVSYRRVRETPCAPVANNYAVSNLLDWSGGVHRCGGCPTVLTIADFPPFIGLS